MCYDFTNDKSFRLFGGASGKNIKILGRYSKTVVYSKVQLII